jgi:amino acid adenylation domain-containing protein
MEKDGWLLFNWDAVAGLFPQGLFDEMFDAYLRLLDSLVDGEGWKRQGRRWLIEHQLRERAWTNETAAPVTPLLAHQLFEEQARMRPEAPAVITSEQALTYGELDLLANRLAHRLRRMGARPNRLVAVVMDKGWQQVAAVLGVLKAGAAYLPVPADLPRDRWWYLLSHGEVELAVTQPHLVAGLEWPTGIRCIVVEDSYETPGGALEAVQGPEDLAYVLFTSGSTGLPKGAMIEHRNVVNRMVDVRGRFGIGPEDRAFGLTALHHDLSVFDLFGVLGSGAALVLPEASGVRDPSRWIDCMAREKVTLWNSVPALLEMLTEELEHRSEQSRSTRLSLRAAFLAGDWIPVSLPDRLRRLVDGVRFFALGGPTETTVWDICYPVTDVDPTWRSLPYGRPMSNTRYHVLNEALEPCPTWVPGELWIAGAGLARGYWRDPDKTAALFVPDPETGERLYRSGDLGRYLPDGTIEFLGRKDFQVKIQGHRIELGEIESVLMQHPAVRLAVVTVVGQERSRQRLAAYVVPPSGITVAAGAATARAALEATGQELDTWTPPPIPPLPPDGQIADELTKVDFKLSEAGVRRGGESAAIALRRPAFDERLLAAYRSRSTWRDFSPEPVPLAALGRLLESLLRVRTGPEPLRVARLVSPDGLDPVQVYLHVQAGRVEEVAAGFYYYHPGEHALVQLAAGVELGPRAHLPVNQEAAEKAAFTLVLIGRIGAVAPAQGARALDLALVEAGAMGQLLMETAPAVGLGLCPLSTFDFGSIAAHLGLADGDKLLHSFLGGLRAHPAGAAVGGDHAARSQGEPGLRQIAGKTPRVAMAPPVSMEPLRAHGQGDLLDRPVALDDLGGLLGVLLGLKTPEWPLPKYRYPSGGALYPVQAYLSIGPDAVAGLEEGMYYYHPRRHGLIPVRPGASLGGPGLSLFLVGQLDAVQPVYGAWALDFCFLEAGYMSHLLAASGPKHGIGLRPAEGTDLERLAPLLDLGPGHVVLHALAGTAIRRTVAPPEAAEAPVAGSEEQCVSAADLEDELRAHLRQKLPSHMVPATFVFLAALPLTPNGKINRKALPMPDALEAERRAGAAPPSTDLERRIAAMLEEVLRIESVGRDQNFFELGGNSIQMVQFYRMLQPVVDVQLTVVDVFNHPTVAALAELLTRGGDDEQARIEAESRAAGKREGRGRLSRQLEKKKQRRGAEEVS